MSDLDLAPLSRAQTLSERAYDDIRRLIVEGSLPAGGRIAVAQLAKRLGVSVTPVREALMNLREAGLVFFQPGGRVEVVTGSPRALREAWELRLALEAAAARLAAERATPEQRAELRRIATTCLDAATEQDEAGFRREDRALHLEIARATDNARLTKAIVNARDLAWVLRDVEYPRTVVLPSIAQDHFDVIDAIDAGEPTEAERAMRRHLDRVFRYLSETDERARQ